MRFIHVLGVTSFLLTTLVSFFISLFLDSNTTVCYLLHSEVILLPSSNEKKAMTETFSEIH